MVANRRIPGTWRGRLLDVQSFEGALTLHLKSVRGGRVRGTFNVEIGQTHSSLRRDGEVGGTYEEGRLELAFIGEELPVKILLSASVQELLDGGVGMSGTYEVSARQFSPIQGGVFCASKDRKVEVVAAKLTETRLVG